MISKLVRKHEARGDRLRIGIEFKSEKESSKISIKIVEKKRFQKDFFHPNKNCACCFYCFLHGISKDGT